MKVSYVALGSNLDHPQRQVTTALKELSALPGTKFLGSSSCYRSEAVGPGDQPDYVNAVAALTTEVPALQWLRMLKSIEAAHGRLRRERWGPRTLDLDILLYADQSITHELLQVPHPRMGQRRFVLQPLYELAPDLTLPCGTSVASLLARCPGPELQKICGPTLP